MVGPLLQTNDKNTKKQKYIKPISVLTHAYLVPTQCMYLEWDWWDESLKGTYLKYQT
jgi:hypothetical protein